MLKAVCVCLCVCWRVRCAHRLRSWCPATLYHLTLHLSSTPNSIAGRDFKQQRDRLQEPVDVVIGTPQRVLQHAEERNLFFGDVDSLVLDEADTMLDRGFGPEVERVLAAVRGKPAPARCVLVSATLTRAVRRLLAERFPSAQPLETGSLHRGVARAEHRFVEVPPRGDKLDALLDLLRARRRDRRTMVFANTVPACRAVAHHLEAAGLARTLSYHGDMPIAERKASLTAFSRDGRGDVSGESAVSELTQPAAAVLVCTDLAARGLDIPGTVDHVVNFDFPLNPVDYLHRSGRTARAGAAGMGCVGCAERDDYDVIVGSKRNNTQYVSLYHKIIHH